MKRVQPILLPSFLVLTISFMLAMCKRYRPDDDIAKYQLMSAGGICSGTVVSGKYISDVPLASENSVSVRINVTKVGQYTITSTKLNGIQFSATGRFSSTGMQNVILHGTGKPVTKGIFTFNTSGCDFDIMVGEKSVDYAVYTVAETDLICQQPALHGKFVKGIPLSTEDRLTFNIHVVAPGAYIIYTNNVNGINFSANGTFTTTGDQTVILHGTGTPADAGNFSFDLHAGNGTCSFKMTCGS